MTFEFLQNGFQNSFVLILIWISPTVRSSFLFSLLGFLSYEEWWCLVRGKSCAVSHSLRQIGHWLGRNIILKNFTNLSNDLEQKLVFTFSYHKKSWSGALLRPFRASGLFDIWLCAFTTGTWDQIQSVDSASLPQPMDSVLGLFSFREV